MKFFDMPYERPQVEQNKKEIEKLTEALKNAQSFAQADEVMQEMDKLLQSKERQQEEHFRKLDCLIRQQQASRKESVKVSPILRLKKMFT